MLRVGAMLKVGARVGFCVGDNVLDNDGDSEG